MHGLGQLRTLLAVIGMLCIQTLGVRGADRLLVIHPAAWTPAVTNFMAFKTRLGLEVTNATPADIAGTNALTAPLLRTFLQSYAAWPAGSNAFKAVLFVGDFNVFPAPSFRVVPAGRETPDTGSYRSDIYYRDLNTEFNRDGDGLFGEFGTNGVSQDFDTNTFAAAFGGIGEDLSVGRIPVSNAWSAAQVGRVLDVSVNFEREVSARKSGAILSAGRIVTVTPLLPADSWDFVLKELVTTLRTQYPERRLTTVVHVDPLYQNRTNIDYAVEGANTTTDYIEGQNHVRSLLEAGSAYGFICNVSHGGPQSDFSLTRQGLGLPTNVMPCVMMSMSCASYQLGRAAYTNGLAVGYLGSTATVTPDVLTVLPPNSPTNRMVSADTQTRAATRLFCDQASLGATFREGLTTYIADIQSPKAADTFQSNQPEVLRNVVGFQIIGDPTLVLARPDADGDGLLDAEEQTIGTALDNPDSDGDGLADGLEYFTAGLQPLVHDGLDVDADGASNADEAEAGTDALNAADRLAITTVQLQGSGLAFAWPSVTGRLYTVAASSNLASGTTWEPAGDFTDLAGTGLPLSYTSTATGGAGFYTIDVRRPPAP